MTDAVRHFEELYRGDPDPWRFADRGAELHRHECILEVASRVPHGSILEVGCSAGALTARLSRLEGRLVAFDLAAVAVARAREVVGFAGGSTSASTSAAAPTFPARDPALLVASVTALPLRPASFDLVVAADGPIGWRLDRDTRMEVYRRLHAALTPGGHVLITEYLRSDRVPEFLKEVGESPLRIVEVRHLHDRPWYWLERRLTGGLRYGTIRRIVGSVALARALDRIGALFGVRTASHVLILAARE